MKKLTRQKRQWLLVGSVLALTVFAFSFLSIDNGRLELIDRTGFGEDVEISRTVERNPNGKITKRIVTRKLQSGKTLWDVLGLIGVPVALAGLGFWFQQLQQDQADKQVQVDREIAESNRREEALQIYFDRLSELLVDKNLFAIAAKQDGTREEKELLNAAVDIINTRTLLILQRFEADRERKTSVIQFLSKAEVISRLKLDLRYASLSNANLHRAHFGGANLIGANLSSANLRGADLSYALLSIANFSDADLSYADLREAYLADADLTKANLSNVRNWTEEQIGLAKLCETVLPEGCNLDPNRDCEK